MPRLVTDRFDPPARDTAVSAALLRRVASGSDPATLRLWAPERAVAFGRQDGSRPGYRTAVRSVAELGYAPVERLAGGRAAVFHEGTIAFAWTVPDRDGPTGIRPRFGAIAGIVCGALQALGLDARVGEVPGEYCPGDHSVNARGRTKLMGVGQRIVRGAAHVGGVIVLGASTRIRDVLVPVYARMGFAWDPASVGSIEDEVGPVPREAVIEALLAELGKRHDLARAPLAAGLLVAAENGEHEHRLG